MIRLSVRAFSRMFVSSCCHLQPQSVEVVKLVFSCSRTVLPRKEEVPDFALAFVNLSTGPLYWRWKRSSIHNRHQEDKLCW